MKNTLIFGEKKNYWNLNNTLRVELWGRGKLQCTCFKEVIIKYSGKQESTNMGDIIKCPEAVTQFVTSLSANVDEHHFEL